MIKIAMQKKSTTVTIQKNKLFAASVIAILFLPILYFFIILPAYAANATSNCVITNIGNPGPNITPPDGCGGTWPFGIKDPSETDRIDQGFDFKCRSDTCQKNNFVTIDNIQTVNILAVASGTIFHHNSSIAPDGYSTCASCTGGGFGNYWPYVHLDQPIIVGGRTYYDIYYGHVHMRDDIPDRTHVTAGQPIAWTTQWGPLTHPPAKNGSDLGGTGGEYWLELGFARHFQAHEPDAGLPDHCNDPGYSCWTQQGQDMKDWILSQNP